MPESKFKTIDGITLHYTYAGLVAATPLVFINSLGTDLRIWDSVVARFADRFSLITAKNGPICWIGIQMPVCDGCGKRFASRGGLPL